MGYFRNSDLLTEQSEQIEQFRDRTGVPKISLHAEARYAQRVLKQPVSKSELLKRPLLRDRCRNGILRNFLDATEVIVSLAEEGVCHLIRRNRCLVMNGRIVVTIYTENSRGGFSATRRKRMRHGKPHGIEAFESLFSRRSA